MLVILLIFLETSMITILLNMKKRIERGSNKKGETSYSSHRFLSLPIAPSRFAFDQLVHSPWINDF